ncbi:MAG: hypothetical protein RR364_08615 [Lachnospiraceae bacterium]
MKKVLMGVIVLACLFGMLPVIPSKAEEVTNPEIVIEEPVVTEPEEPGSNLGEIVAPQPRWANIISCRAMIGGSGSRVISESSINCNKVCSITITMELQRVISGTWMEVRTWSETVHSDSAFLSRTITTATNSQYQVLTRFSANGEKANASSSVLHN